VTKEDARSSWRGYPIQRHTCHRTPVMVRHLKLYSFKMKKICYIKEEKKVN